MKGATLCCSQRGKEVKKTEKNLTFLSIDTLHEPIPTHVQITPAEGNNLYTYSIAGIL